MQPLLGGEQRRLLGFSSRYPRPGPSEEHLGTRHLDAQSECPGVEAGSKRKWSCYVWPDVEASDRESEQRESKNDRCTEFTLMWHSTFYENLRQLRASLLAQMIKNLRALQETQIQSLGWEDPLEKGVTTHSSILAWRIPRTEPGRLQSLWLQRVRHDWVTNTFNL